MIVVLILVVIVLGTPIAIEVAKSPGQNTLTQTKQEVEEVIIEPMQVGLERVILEPIQARLEELSVALRKYDFIYWIIGGVLKIISAIATWLKAK